MFEISSLLGGVKPAEVIEALGKYMQESMRLLKGLDTKLTILIENKEKQNERV